jgi:hypothetical protein
LVETYLTLAAIAPLDSRTSLGFSGRQLKIRCCQKLKLTVNVPLKLIERESSFCIFLARYIYIYIGYAKTYVKTNINAPSVGVYIRVEINRSHLLSARAKVKTTIYCTNADNNYIDPYIYFLYIIYIFIYIPLMNV